MQRLAGSDAGFLFIESESQTSTCVDLAVLAAPADGEAPLTLDGLRRHLAERLPLVPSLRWRLERIPFGVNHPVWIEDPDFDLDYHVRHATIAEPGTAADLDASVAAVLPELLDLRHPGWQVVLVDGLADGRQALVFKFHHALADGAALISILDGLLGDDPAPPPPTVAVPVPAPPRRSALFFAGLAANLRAWLALPVMLWRTIMRFRAVEQRRKASPIPTPKPMNDAPASVLNPGPTPDRVYGRTRLPLAEVQQVKRAAGTTLSDVLLAIVAGALRNDLLARADLPDKPLVVNVPVADDDPGAGPRQWGNKFANYFSFLATDVADPAERLAAVAARNAEAKLQLEIQGPRTLSAWLDRIPPAIAEPAARGLQRRTARLRDQPDFNVLVSNVRIPNPVWHVGGQAVEEMYMSGPVADESGLNVTIVGYGDQLHVSLATNPLAVDDPEALAQRLHDELATLLVATAAPASTPEGRGAPALG